MLSTDSFWKTPEGKLAQHRVRDRARLLLEIDGVEPQSKRMPAADKEALKRQVAGALLDAKRGAFRGPIALQIELATTTANPPQAHTIAKSLLDLLGKQGNADTTWQKTRLYRDDEQIQALSVSCVHGEAKPRISIAARRFNGLIDDVEVAAEAARERDDADQESGYREEHERDARENLRRLLANEQASRAELGDKLYEGLVGMERWHVQRDFFSKSMISVPVLGWLYGRPKGPFMAPLHAPWPDVIRESGLRIQLGELPTASGASEAFLERIDAALTEFNSRWGWLIEPLVVPVGLQVIVQPNAATPPKTQADLDNIVRDYLLPKIVPTFGTVTGHVWTINFEKLRKSHPELAARWESEPRPPKGAKDGVTGYEVWRLPPAPKGEPGFVSVSLTAQPDVRGDLMQQVERELRDWTDGIEAERQRKRLGV